MADTDVNCNTQKAEGIGGSSNIRLCADGKYRWIYEFSMLKNPGILFTIMKILALASCAPALLVTLLDLDEGIEAFVSGAEVLGVLLLIMLPLSLLSYFIVAALYGWKYIVLFEMDEEGVTHIQQDKQFKKAQGIALLTMLAAVSGKDLWFRQKMCKAQVSDLCVPLRGYAAGIR